MVLCKSLKQNMNNTLVWCIQFCVWLWRVTGKRVALWMPFAICYEYRNGRCTMNDIPANMLSSLEMKLWISWFKSPQLQMHYFPFNSLHPHALIGVLCTNASFFPSFFRPDIWICIYVCVRVLQINDYGELKKMFVCISSRKMTARQINLFIFFFQKKRRKNFILHSPQYFPFQFDKFNSLWVSIGATILKCGAKQIRQMKRTKNNNIKMCVCMCVCSVFHILLMNVKDKPQYRYSALCCSSQPLCHIVTHYSCRHFPLRFNEQNFMKKKFNQRTRPTISKSNYIQCTQFPSK